MISDNTLKTMIEMFTYYLPGKQVSPGDNWNVTLKYEFRWNDTRYNNQLSSGWSKWQCCKYYCRIRY